MKVDFHTHSHYSDGTHPPAFVLDRARENGVTDLALTDHDCVEGYLEAKQNGLDHGLQLVAGVEISTRWENLEIHVLGLGFDPDYGPLNQLLRHQQQKRRERLAAIESKLVAAGITGLGEYMSGLPCVSPGRAHVARFLASSSRTATTKKAFRALSKNGRFYVRPEWCEMQEAAELICAAGGLAVLAHPHRYPLNRKAVQRLLADFRAAGGEAMEICCSSMTREKIDSLAALSLEHELWVSAGSDFHSSLASWMDVGKLSSFPETVKKNAIWTHPRWHFQQS